MGGEVVLGDSNEVELPMVGRSDPAEAASLGGLAVGAELLCSLELGSIAVDALNPAVELLCSTEPGWVIPNSLDDSMAVDDGDCSGEETIWIPGVADVELARVD